jgi:hypothetical protein
VGIRLAKRSIDRITYKIRLLTRRNVGQSLEQICDRLNPVIIGWTNYFALADAGRHMQRLDEHLRRRLRQIVWKQWKTPAGDIECSGYWVSRNSGRPEPVERARAAGEYLLHHRFTKR